MNDLPMLYFTMETWIARNDDGRYTVSNPPPDLERVRKKRP